MSIRGFFRGVDHGTTNVSERRHGAARYRFVSRLAAPMTFAAGGFLLAGWLFGISSCGTKVGQALFAGSNILILTILIWISTKWLRTRETESKQSINRYRFLADTMPQIIWTAKPDGNLDYYNQRWFDYTGLTIEQTKDWGWKTVLHPDDLQNCVERWTKAVATEGDYEVEYRFKRASDGLYRWHLGRAFPLRDRDGKIIQWVGTCTDIEDQKRVHDELEKRVAERSVDLVSAKEKLQSVLDAATQVSIVASDTEGQITVFNRGAEQMLGYTSSEMVGRRSPAILHLESELVVRGQELTEEMGKSVQGPDVLFEKARHGQPEEREWTFVRKDGKTLTVHLAVTASYDTNGTIMGFLGVATDISARTSAEKTLRDQALILDLANDTIIIRDREDCITYWNKGAERLYGWSKEEALGQITHSFFKTQFPQSLASINAQLLATGYWEGELVHTRRDGALVNVASSWTLQRDEAKRAVSVIEMNYDFTARKKAERELQKSNERLDAILSSSIDGIIVYEAVRDGPGALLDLRFAMINPAAEKLMELKATDLLGRTLLEKFPTVVSDGLFEKFTRIIDGNVALDFEHHSLDDGTSRWYRLAGVKVGDGLALSYTEITARKISERRLQEAKERAELADDAKSDFLASMSHEIRTPMNGVIGMTGLLLDTGLTAEQHNLADTIRTSAESLLGLINDILDFSKIEAGKLSFEELDFDLRKVVEDTLERMAGQAQAKGIELVGVVEPEIPTMLRGDPGRVQQVLTNLISNAIKFTKSGEVVLRVTTEAKTEMEVQARFEIKDTGPGIPPETQAQLFQPFVQADSSTSRNFGGTGLGLAICKRLAECMNGSIGVESKLGEGSTFWVIVRFSRQLEVEVESPRIHEFIDRRVLVVDDNKTSRQLIDQQITAWRLRNGDARTGAEALTILDRAVAEKDPYAVAIVDLEMPEMNGLALLRKINSDPLLSATRLILLTPFGKSIPAEELKTLHVAACCAKPVRQSALFDCIIQTLAGLPEVSESRQPGTSLSKPLRSAELGAPLERAVDRPLPDDGQSNLMEHREDESVRLVSSVPPATAGPLPRFEKSTAADRSWETTDRHLLATLMDNLPDLIYFKDRESRFTAVNRLFLCRAGLSHQSEIIGKTDKDLYADEHASAALVDEQKIIATGQSIVGVEEKETWPDGQETWVSTTKVPWRDANGTVIGTFGLSRDITTRKLAEANLKLATEAAEKAGRTKSEFLANMSHEIRTPMNGVIGMTALLLDSNLDPQQREFTETIDTSANALLKIINDILDFSRIEASKLTLEVLDFDLIKSVEDALAVLAERAQGKGIELVSTILPGTPTRLRGDADRLGQILANLIANAIKFTEIGETVVRVSKERETETYAILRFEVQDTGIGISPEAQAQLFQPFKQADGSCTRKYGGTGLGLAIAKQLVAMMQGEIGIQSQPGRGSTFWFTVQLEKQVMAVKVPERSFSGLFDAQVLVVDDNATNCQVLCRQILAWKMQARGARNGAEALKMLQAAAREGKPYGLVLLDAEMPEMDGLTLARAIQADPAIDETRLILLAGFSTRISPEELRGAGIADCCFKPVRQSRLFECLADAAHGRSTKRSALAEVPVEPIPPPPQIRVLIAEDNAVNQMVTLGQLKKLGYNADIVSDGLAVLEALDRTPYSIVLMDCQMPELDGYETTRRIRARLGDFPQPYIIAMTAHAMQGDREKCLAAGMNDYISKPVHVKALAAILARGPFSEIGGPLLQEQ